MHFCPTAPQVVPAVEQAGACRWNQARAAGRDHFPRQVGGLAGCVGPERCAAATFYATQLGTGAAPAPAKHPRVGQVLSAQMGGVPGPSSKRTQTAPGRAAVLTTATDFLQHLQRT